jgi:60S ribosomal subunit assembly/export protein LOC1
MMAEPSRACAGRGWLTLALDVGRPCPNRRPGTARSFQKKFRTHLHCAICTNTPHHTYIAMAPTKPSKGKTSTKTKTSKIGAKASAKSKSSASKPEGISKNRQKKLTLAKPGGAQKTKSKTDGRKKKRVYTEKELDIPALNGIIPAGIAKPKGVKKGKVFVDDPAGMMAIMSIVHAEKEGRLESKIMRARQLEEIREAKRVEAEERKDEKEKAFDERKKDIKKKGRRKSAPKKEDDDEDGESKKSSKTKDGKYKPRKRVSFG